MKESVGTSTFMYPCPLVAVGTYDAAGKPNVMTVAWTGVVSGSPACISVSVRKETYSYQALMTRKAFTVNIPSQDLLKEIDYIGKTSGRDTDKFAATGLTPVRSTLVDAPYIEEFPVNIECRVIKVEDLGLHTMFVGEIKDVKVRSDCLDESHMPVTEKIKPIAFLPGDGYYYALGKRLEV
ncbi:MAG: flavin reductase family protein [Firmicutes bacterium]|nr:flavin reductase family protein [Bacillota bacterium]